MKMYVLGFLYSNEEVLLMRKKRPKNQEGKLNGVGGKVEEGETMHEAMCRESWEELAEPDLPWYRIGTMRNNDNVIAVFAAEVPREQLWDFEGAEDEPVSVYHMNELGTLETVRNIPWLVRLVVDSDIRNFDVEYYNECL